MSKQNIGNEYLITVYDITNSFFGKYLLFVETGMTNITFLKKKLFFFLLSLDFLRCRLKKNINGD